MREESVKTRFLKMAKRLRWPREQMFEILYIFLQEQAAEEFHEYLDEFENDEPTTAADH